MNHLDDDAELYALGLTERDRDVDIESHVGQCPPCRARVGAAEFAVAALAGTLPRIPAAAPRRAWWTVTAAAAAVAFATTSAFQGLATMTAASQLARTDAALTEIVGSHFEHTTLTANPGVVAKALYARDGSWYYIVATGAPRDSRVTIRWGAITADAGTLSAEAPGRLFIRGPGKVDEIAVVSGDQVVARGKPVY